MSVPGDGDMSCSVTILPDGRLHVRMAWPKIGELWMMHHGQIMIGPEDAVYLTASIQEALYG